MDGCDVEGSSFGAFFHIECQDFGLAHTILQSECDVLYQYSRTAAVNTVKLGSKDCFVRRPQGGIGRSPRFPC